MNATPVLYDAALPELEALMRGWNQPAFRARQLYRQLYVKLADDPGTMTDLPLALRQRLAHETCLGNLRLVDVQKGDNGLTRKALFALPDASVVETVLMIYPDRATVCVSTQAGCAMGCVFCATGKLGLLRNLETGQIVEQVVWAARELLPIGDDHSQVGQYQPVHATASPAGSLPRRITNVVFMGMGESFANYDRWWAAVERLHDPQGFNLGARNMTVSTVGLVPGIRRLAQAELPVNLAVSLHAPDDALRSELMPVNRRYPIGVLLEATREYIEQTHRRVSFEYVLLQGQNDRPEQARALATLLRNYAPRGKALLYHVNVIPWNPVPGTPLGRSERQRVLAFQQVLQEHAIPCTVRVERGVDIAAACGQLAGKHG